MPYLHLSLEWWQIDGGALIASVFAHSWLSPDVDRYLFGGQRLGSHHRRLPHFWPVVVIAWFSVHQFVPLVWQWVGLAVIAAWLSHICADAIFGKVPIWIRLNGKWRKMGLGLKTGGDLEKKLVYPVLLLSGVVIGSWMVFGQMQQIRGG